MTRARLTLRLAWRGAGRDRGRLLSSGLFVGLAVAFGILVLGSTGRSGADVRITLDTAAGAQPRDAAGAQAVHYWKRPFIVVRAGGHQVELALAASAIAGGMPAESRAHGVQTSLPVAATATTFRLVRLRLVGNGRTRTAILADADPRDGLVGTGIAAGRRPLGPDEIALTRSLATRLIVVLGGYLNGLPAPHGVHAFRVVGILSHPVVLANGGSAEGLVAVGSLNGAAGGSRAWLINLGPANAFSGGSSGGGSEGFAYDISGGGIASWSHDVAVIVGFSIVQALVLMLPLFTAIAILAVGLEQRARDAALLELAGADRRLVRAVACVRGVIIGAIAAGAGLVLAYGTAMGFGWVPDLNAVAVLIPAGSALLGGIVASLASARSARRLRASSSGDGLVRHLDLGRASLRALGMALVGVLCGVGVAVAPQGVWTVLPALGCLLAVIGLVPTLAPLFLAIPGLVPQPSALRASTRAVGRMRWVSAPAATAVALVSVLLVGYLGTGLGSSGGGAQSIHVGDRRIASIYPDTRSNSAGVLVAPQAIAENVAGPARPASVQPAFALTLRSDAPQMLQEMVGLDPSTATDARLYAIDPSALAALGVPSSTLARHTVVYLGLPSRLGPATVSNGSTSWRVTRVPLDWPASAPHTFVSRAQARLVGIPADAPTWIVHASRPITGDLIGALRTRATAAGLHLTVADDIRDSQMSNTTAARVFVAGTALVLTLVFGGVATFLVLAEGRDERRKLTLVGASPQHQRLGAALTAFGVGVAGVALAAVPLSALVVLSIERGGASSLLDLVGAVMLAQVAAPFLLAVGAATLVRGTRIGRLGQRPLDAASTRG